MAAAVVGFRSDRARSRGAVVRWLPPRGRVILVVCCSPSRARRRRVAFLRKRPRAPVLRRFGLLPSAAGVAFVSRARGPPARTHLAVWVRLIAVLPRDRRARPLGARHAAPAVAAADVRRTQRRHSRRAHGAAARLALLHTACGARIASFWNVAGTCDPGQHRHSTRCCRRRRRSSSPDRPPTRSSPRCRTSGCPLPWCRWPFAARGLAANTPASMGAGQGDTMKLSVEFPSVRIERDRTAAAIRPGSRAHRLRPHRPCSITSSWASRSRGAQPGPTTRRCHSSRRGDDRVSGGRDVADDARHRSARPAAAHPTMVAKQVSTPTRSRAAGSGSVGRGLAASEYEALGADFHTRGARMDEAIRCCERTERAAGDADGTALSRGRRWDGAQPPKGRRLPI